MQDFNLRPEVMGFGRPERLLKAEAAPPAASPADQWTRRGDFEVNGLGQLRTVLALPASEAEIAASMRHADAPPIPRKRDEQAAFEDWLNETYPSGDVEAVQHQWVASGARAAWLEESGYANTKPFAQAHAPCYACHCDGCVADRKGRFQPHASDDKRPLTEIIGTRRQPDLTSSAAAAKMTRVRSWRDI